MSIETELKLSISPQDMRRLKRAPFLRTLLAQRTHNHKLYSVYYDTPALKLHEQAMALRLRRVGNQWLQTLKGGGQMSAGLHQRNEWEAPVALEQLDFEVLKACGGKLPHGVRHHLQPVFVTDFTRNIRLLDFEGAQIELCMDSGEIRAGRKHHTISELELELKSGTPDKLFKLAEALLDIVPLKIETTNKAQYGYWLFSGALPSKHKTRFPVFERHQSVSDVLRQLIAAHLEQVQAHVAEVLTQQDEEPLHQVRVGLRRLRLLLSNLQQAEPDKAIKPLRRELAKFSNTLGELREWDVFITQTLRSPSPLMPSNKALGQLRKASEHQQKLCRSRIEQHLASVDLQRLWIRMGAWLHGEVKATQSVTLQHFVRHTLKKQRTRVDIAGKAIDTDDAAQLHRLRIQCKKLRYSLEMFGVEQHEATLHSLMDLQDVLGNLNDISVAHRLLDALEPQVGSASVAQMRLVIEHSRQLEIESFNKAWKRFRATLPSPIFEGEKQV